MPPVAILACVVITLSIIRQISPRIGGHPLVFLGFNVMFLVLVVPVQALAWLVGFLAANYLLALCARRYLAANIAVFVLPAVICFIVLKKYEFLPLSSLYGHIPEFLGLSFIIFRTLSIIIKARDTLEVPGIISYLNFCLSMVTFLSGPIQRYRAFSEDMERRKDLPLDGSECALALTRLMNGVIKLIYLAPLAQHLQDYCMLAQQKSVTVVVRNEITITIHNPLEKFGDLTPSLGFGLAALCYLLFLYFNFSGYTDMMIGLGRLLGFCLPENFDNPFMATNFLDFWKRWHISLSLWFRDYCFTPILKRMVKTGIKDPAIATLPAYFISFGLLGIWHGRTWPFIMCGLMFAMGSSANHLWRSRMANKKTLKLPSWYPLCRSFSSALTLFYISLAITGLWLPGAMFTAVWHSFSILQAAGSFSLIIFCLAGFLYLIRGLWHVKWAQAMMIVPVKKFFSMETSAFIAAKIFLAIVWLFVFSARMPDFIYQQF